MNRTHSVDVVGIDSQYSLWLGYIVDIRLICTVSC